ncbi:AI-2E family transporter [soil metagenome]
MIAIGVASLAIVLLALLYQVSHVLLLGFAGVLLGILLQALAGLVTRLKQFSTGMSLAAVALVLAALLGGLVWFAGATLKSQADQFAKQLPRSFDQLATEARDWPVVGAWLAIDDSESAGHPQTNDAAQLRESIRSAAPKVASTLSTVIGSLVGVASALVVVLVVGIYVAATPLVYARGVVHLTPKSYRPRAREVIATLVYTLRHWLIGQGITMLVIATMTGIGLYFIGVKLWLLLAILAGLFNFIPTLGPFISFVPAVLLAWSDDASLVPWVIGLYLVAQSIEGYLLTPLVQRRAVDVPPALLIIAQMTMASLAGILGVMLAAPLTAVAIVIVRMLYVKDTLGDTTFAPAQDAAIQAMAARIEHSHAD